MPRLRRASHKHFILLPTLALVAATIVGAWQSGGGSSEPVERAATTPAGSIPADIQAMRAATQAVATEAVARESVAPTESIHEPGTEIAALTGADSTAPAVADSVQVPEAAIAIPTETDSTAPAATESTQEPETEITAPAKAVAESIQRPETEIAAPANAAAPAEAVAKSIQQPETEIATLTDADSAAAWNLPTAPGAAELGPAAARAPVSGSAEAEVPAGPAEETRAVRVRRGAILMNILVKAGVPRVEADRAITALRPVYDPRGLQIDQILRLTFEVAEGAKDRFVGLYFAPDPDHTVAVDLNSDGSYTAARLSNSAAARTAGAAGGGGVAATESGNARRGESAETASIDPAASTAPTAPAKTETVIDFPASQRPAKEARGIRVRRGATLMNILVQAGVPRIEADAAINALRPIYDPRGLQAGQTIQLRFEVAEGAKDLFLGLDFESDVDHSVTVDLTNDGSYKAARVARSLSAELVRASGSINTSLFEAGVRAGVPIPVMIQFIQLYSFDVDFQRDIWAGDKFEVMFDSFSDAQNRPTRQGEILYASLSVRGQILRLYRFTPANGRADYFNEEGESARKMLMRTPVDGARLSSRYGMRRHPILRYTKMHRGIDFAAPTGTPIYAAGDGTVTRAGRNGAYGRYIRIRHNSTYGTAYAHLKGFARGIRSGERVRQGQVIGYVGSSGRSTGPHLHYEILRGGRQINPLKLRMASGERLKGEDLASYMATRGDMRTRYASLARDLGVARNKPKRQHACAGASTETSKTDATDPRGC